MLYGSETECFEEDNNSRSFKLQMFSNNDNSSSNDNSDDDQTSAKIGDKKRKASAEPEPVDKATPGQGRS